MDDGGASGSGSATPCVKSTASAQTACSITPHSADTKAELTKAMCIAVERASKLESELLEYKAKYQAVYSEHTSLKVEFATKAKSLMRLETEVKQLQSKDYYYQSTTTSASHIPRRPSPISRRG